MLIVDMPMPECCEKCNLCDYEEADCLVNNRNTLPHNGKRRDWCPIKGELVRCGECKYFDGGDCKNFDKRELGWDDFDRSVSHDWFCADGERMDGEG